MPPKNNKNFPPVAVLTVTAITGLSVTVSTVGTREGATGKNRRVAVSSPLTTWVIYWGDGTYEGGTENPPSSLTHGYADPSGTVTITLQVTAENSLTAQAAIVVTPLNPDPPPDPPPPTVPPTVVSITRMDSTPTEAAQVRWRVTFNENVQGVAAGNFSLVPTNVTGASIAVVSGSGQVWTVTALTGTTPVDETGTLGLNLSTVAGITSVITGLTLASTLVGQVYTTQGAVAPPPPPPPPPPVNPPTVLSITRLDISPTSNAQVRWQVTFSEPVTGVTLGKFGLSTTGISGASLAAISGSQASYIVTALTGTTASTGTIGLNLTTVSGITAISTGLTLAASFVGQLYNTVAVAPPPPPPPPPPPSGTRTLQGGWNFPFDYQRGSIAINFSTMKMWMVGHSQRQEILEYDLPTMGTGTNESQWPLVFPTRVIERFWGTGNAYGLVYWQNKLWVTPRVFYDQPPSSEDSLTIYAEDGEEINFPNLKRQVFSGFVKTGPGLDPYIGGGGYDSGQGTRSGPSLATLASNVLIEYQWPGSPGAVDPVTGIPANWNLRAPREPNYRPLRTGTINTTQIPEDSFVGWIPRTINGVLEGRWASDRIYGGGLALPEGITYWPYMGTGDLDYVTQTLTFGYFDLDRTYEYLYSTAGQLVSYQARPDLGLITGQELDSAGNVYLLDLGQGWFIGTGSCVLRMFG